MTCLLLHEEDTKYDELLHQHSFTTVNIPVLQTVIHPLHHFFRKDESHNTLSGDPPRDLAQQDESSFRRHLESFDGYIITSKHALSFLVENKINIRGKYLAVVGPQTSAKVLAFCLTQDYNPQDSLITEHHGEALGDRITKNFSNFPLTWLFLRGNKSLDIIPEKLDEAKMTFSQLTVYNVVKCGNLAAQLEMLDYDNVKFVVFFSPSGVEYTYDVLVDNLNKSTALLAFGKSTCKEVRRLFSHQFIDLRTCKEPTPKGVLNAIMEKESS